MYMPNIGPNARTQRHLYSTGWRRGFASGLTQILGLASGNAKNLRQLTQNIPTCWYILRWVRKSLASGVLPNANPRRQVFCFLVEYRLYSNIRQDVFAQQIKVKNGFLFRRFDILTLNINLLTSINREKYLISFYV